MKKVSEHDIMAQGYIEGMSEIMTKEGLPTKAIELLNEEDEELVPLVKDGLRQILNEQGFDKESPITGLGITAFYRMMAIIGFGCESQRLLGIDGNKYLDHMVMKHQVTGMDAHLYNQIIREPIEPMEWNDETDD